MPLIRPATRFVPHPPARRLRRRTALRHALPCALAFAIAAALELPAAAQVRDPGETLSAGENAEPMSATGGTLGGRPMSGSGTIGESSGSSRRSGPVRDASTRSMLSGPMSESSRGPVSDRRTLSGGGSMTENSAGAVKHDIDQPLGSRISQPLRELGPLQDQMRAIRLGTGPAVQAVDAPVSAEIAPDDLAPPGLEPDPPHDDAHYDNEPLDAAPADEAHLDAPIPADEELPEPE